MVQDVKGKHYDCFEQTKNSKNCLSFTFMYLVSMVWKKTKRISRSSLNDVYLSSRQHVILENYPWDSFFISIF